MWKDFPGSWKSLKSISKRKHSDLVELMPAMKSTSARGASLSSQVDCPLCEKSLTLKSYKKHMASHQQQLALFALPANLNETNDDNKIESEEDASIHDAENSEDEEASEAINTEHQDTSADNLQQKDIEDETRDQVAKRSMNPTEGVEGAADAEYDKSVDFVKFLGRKRPTVDEPTDKTFGHDRSTHGAASGQKMETKDKLESDLLEEEPGNDWPKMFSRRPQTSSTAHVPIPNIATYHAPDLDNSSDINVRTGQEEHKIKGKFSINSKAAEAAKREIERAQERDRVTESLAKQRARNRGERSSDDGRAEMSEIEIKKLEEHERIVAKNEIKERRHREDILKRWWRDAVEAQSAQSGSAEQRPFNAQRAKISEKEIDREVEYMREKRSWERQRKRLLEHWRREVIEAQAAQSDFAEKRSFNAEQAEASKKEIETEDERMRILAENKTKRERERKEPIAPLRVKEGEKEQEEMVIRNALLQQHAEENEKDEQKLKQATREESAQSGSSEKRSLNAKKEDMSKEIEMEKERRRAIDEYELRKKIERVEDKLRREKEREELKREIRMEEEQRRQKDWAEYNAFLEYQAEKKKRSEEELEQDTHDGSSQPSFSEKRSSNTERAEISEMETEMEKARELPIGVIEEGNLKKDKGREEASMDELEIVYEKKTQNAIEYIRSANKQKKERDHEEEHKQAMHDDLSQPDFSGKQIPAPADLEHHQSADKKAKPIHQPTYSKVHTKHIDIRTLNHYDIEYEYEHGDREYIIILQEMSLREMEVLFEHTRKLRAKDPSSEKDWARRRGIQKEVGFASKEEEEEEEEGEGGGGEGRAESDGAGVDHPDERDKLE